MRKRPGIPGRSRLAVRFGLGSSLGVDHLSFSGAIADRDLTRLLGLGNFAHEVDVQQSVLETRVLDLDMIGKLEDAFKGTRGDTLIEHFAVLFFLGLFGAFDRQRVFFRFDRKLVLTKSGYSDSDAVVV